MRNSLQVTEFKFCSRISQGKSLSLILENAQEFWHDTYSV